MITRDQLSVDFDHSILGMFSIFTYTHRVKGFQDKTRTPWLSQFIAYTGKNDLKNVCCNEKCLLPILKSSCLSCRITSQVIVRK